MTNFHHGHLDDERIQRVLRALRDAHDAGLTTIQLGDITGSTRASSDVSEARAALREVNSPYEIQTDYVGLSPSGRRVFRYRLVETI